MDRRSLLRGGVVAAGALGFGGRLWGDAFAAPPVAAQPGPSPYGPLQPADANGVLLPAGFRSRV
ncbi:MAG: translocation protein TolB, partial [Actinomycetota bacterium]|nr:translocation protein TolB [Actinomycetota bacterium]